ncbi:MAG TPA: glycoside hydrolase family 32 protein [Acidobacterium sp.]|uniref:beta-fructofuranosidase n=1 Tax=Acidobacterium capsulatum (strain ATCC 51196 / DSM 11244 / BCRC 80197 / JCM 7670 / NBRC 15755 / NCIMB 13165 / 161) TaxID=240015 RepID=C1F7Y1_ACIC5|nr:glycosyl hydrolase family, 32 [Acidobacterium capsulatum ATCC 51196]HCT59324.1 glycoside hydrolase family 32 protein [Acidobacterium sp.]
MNRRELFRTAAGLAGAIALGQADWAINRPRNTAIADLEARLALDPRRPQFHLLPQRNWMNDPNGPIYWKGQYHMFFQYNPDAAVWGDMHWAHAVSPDMVHWRHLPIALAPTPGGPDAAGCFSGTAVVDNGVVTVLYTGVVNSTLANATLNDGQHIFRESQCLATSIDPDLKTWKKLAAPVIAAPPPGLSITGFRDPSPWRSGEWWYLAVGSGNAHTGGDVLLYRSRDLRHWQYLHKLVSGEQSAKGAINPVANGDMWECPDFFPLGEKHVLIYSSRGGVHWQTGTLDKEAMRFHPEKTGILDYGAFYAAKTQLDQQGNRILWGWIPEQRPAAEYSAAGWAGMMSLPRVLRMQPDGGLGVAFSPAVHSLRTREHRLDPSQKIQSQLAGLFLPRATGEILAQLNCDHRAFSFSLIAKFPHKQQSQPIVEIAYDPSSRQIFADKKAVPIAWDRDNLLQLHIYVDGSVAEILLSGKAVYTKRFYYAGEDAPGIYVHLQAAGQILNSFRLWHLKAISPNRLTTG